MNVENNDGHVPLHKATEVQYGVMLHKAVMWDN